MGSTHASIPHHTTLDADPPGSARVSGHASAPCWGVPGSAWHFTSWVPQGTAPLTITDLVKHGTSSTWEKRRAREPKSSGELEKRARQPTFPMRSRARKQGTWLPCV